LEDQWRLLKEVKTTNNNHIQALAEVSADSPWFSGHFPGEPILPGIAVVHIVKQAITQETLKKGDKLELHALKRVRFTQPVRPGDTLSVDISSEDKGEEILFHFKVLCKENIVSSGMIAAKKIK
jgi:3-hydroxymyristoyl/3-hydroxydecanoyl-(acyl carrier protein) dehydratase